MKKIDTNKSLIFDKKINNLKVSLEFIGKEGYFSNNDFSVYIKGILKSVLVSDKVDYPYTNKYDNHGFDYFIPKDSAVFIEEPKKKTYRPYKDFAEFANHMGLRDSDKVQFIGFRSKHSTSRYDLVYNGYEVDSFGTVYIHLGSLAFTLNELFNNYEYELNSFELVPFGVLKDEED